MKVAFEDDDLEELEIDPRSDGGLPQGVVRSFRRRMQQIRAAQDEQDFHKNRGMNFEKLRGDRAGQHSIRLNDQFRLIVRIEGAKDEKTVIIIEITDYH